MNAVPPRSAGVERLVMVCRRRTAAQSLCWRRPRSRRRRVYRIGGARRWRRSLRTATIAPVDKIVGPGNAMWRRPSAGVRKVGIE